MVPPGRRTLLQTLGTGGALFVVTGCSELIGDSNEAGTPTKTPNSEQTDAVVNMALRADEPSEDDVVFRDLPGAEQDIVRAALQEGSYRVCTDIPEAVQSFAGRFGEARFLTYRNDRYGMWIRIKDAVFVDTTSPPSPTPDCG